MSCWLTPLSTIGSHAFTSEDWMVRWGGGNRHIFTTRYKRCLVPDKDLIILTYAGIDIARRLAQPSHYRKSYRTETFPNDAKGIRRFISKLDPAIHHCVMEATGNYCFLLLYLLDKSGIRASLINPKKIKNYARVMMSVTKTVEHQVQNPVHILRLSPCGKRCQRTSQKYRMNTHKYLVSTPSY